MMVSIIVPVYNVAPYIERCLLSIVKQSYLGKFELILVNDCSTDNSIQIAKNILQQVQFSSYSILHHNKNKGLSQARNTGVEHAMGDYLVFVDSDDFLHQGFLQIVIDGIKNYSSEIIAIYPYFYYESHCEDTKQCNVVKTFNQQQAMEILFDVHHHMVQPWAWGKIFNRSLFTKNQISFPVGMRFEDLPTMLRLLNACNSYTILPYTAYYYVQERTDSIMNKLDTRYFYDYFKMLDLIASHIKNNHLIINNFSKFEFHTYKKLLNNYFSLKNVSPLKKRKLLCELLKRIKNKKFLFKIGISTLWWNIKRITALSKSTNNTK